MKKTVLALLLIAAVYAAPAEAHTLNVDGTVGAVLHADPIDSPVAGQPSTLYFDFKDSEKAFSASDYSSVTLSIESNGEAVESTPLIFSDGQNASASYAYTFPKPGVYQIMVTGVPNGTGPGFSLTYDQRVEAGEAAGTNPIGAFFGVHGGHVLVTGLLIFALVAVIGWEKRKEYKAQREGTNSIT